MSHDRRLTPRRRLAVPGALGAVLVALVGTAAGVSASTTSARPATAPADGVPTDVSATTMFSTGNVIVAGMSIAPDGRVFYVGPAHKAIYVWSPASQKVTVFGTVPGATDLYGVAVSPQFTTNHFVYVYAALAGTSTVAPHEVLSRYTGSRGKGTAYKVLRNVGPIGTEHVGGKMVFDPSGNIVIVIGDGGDPANSQNPALDHGKILRLTPLGKPAPGNPGFADKAVFATGIRNSIGMAYDPESGHLWETENGPECNDELNIITAGGNYGWGPSEVCDGTPQGTNQDGLNPTLPAETISTVIAPVGATFCDSCGISEAEGDLVYGSYLDDTLRNVTLDPTRTTVVSDDVLYQDTSGLLAVESSPVDGSIWFADTGHTVQRLTQTP